MNAMEELNVQNRRFWWKWMERFKYRVGQEDLGVVTLFWIRRRSSSASGAWTTYFSFPRKILRMLCGYFVQFEGCVAYPLQIITAIVSGSKWSCLLLRIELQDALSEVTKIYLLLKWKVFVDDITALLMVKEKKSLKRQKSDEKVTRGYGGKRVSNCRSVRMERKERVEMIASCDYLEDELRQYSNEEGVTMTGSGETLEVDLRTQIK